MIPIRMKWLLTLGLVLSLGAVWAQGQDTATASKPAPAASKPVTGTETVADPDQEEAADEIPEVPKEIQEAIDKRDEVHATMERFVPTEKLSEDRAVSFPNDI